jgi:arginyl-tRNA synthetase
MKDALAAGIAAAVKELFDVDSEVELTRPDEQFGDYATNVALQLSKQLGKKPCEIAEMLIVKSRENLVGLVADVSVAGPGFLNLTLTDQALADIVSNAQPQSRKGQQTVVEFGDPNPFKEMHLGHLYTAVVGDAISRLLEADGSDVKRVSYHGDVGMHVAKAMWALLEGLKEQGRIHTYTDDVVLDVSSFDTLFKLTLGQYYARGAKAFDEDEKTAEEIKQINRHIYAKDNDLINKLHSWGADRSFGYFDQIFHELGVVYVPNGRYLESQVSEVGLKYVRDNTGTVFEESDGAVIYRGEKVGLHTRVFINSNGLPTYETKDLGLAEQKNSDYPEAAMSIIITANEQSEYFKVMLAALAEITPELAAKTRHLAHGFLSLTTGKMSSRTGEVYSAADLMSNVEQAVKNQYPDTDPANKTYLAAIKYALLKHRIGSDIVFDIQESVSLEGNSGPYLQYAHARACSILAKAGEQQAVKLTDLQAGERSLLRKLTEYSEVIELATAERMPHHICTYLYELAQTFNRFYEQNRVIGDPRQTIRLLLVGHYADTLMAGLSLLGIAAPKQM